MGIGLLPGGGVYIRLSGGREYIGGGLLHRGRGLYRVEWGEGVYRGEILPVEGFRGGRESVLSWRQKEPNPTSK